MALCGGRGGGVEFVMLLHYFGTSEGAPLAIVRTLLLMYEARQSASTRAQTGGFKSNPNAHATINYHPIKCDASRANQVEISAELLWEQFFAKIQ